MLQRAILLVVVLEVCIVSPSNTNILFAILSIFVPSSNLVYPSQELIYKTAILCE